jgi:hypothetical protein
MRSRIRIVALVVVGVTVLLGTYGCFKPNDPVISSGIEYNQEVLANRSYVFIAMTAQPTQNLYFRWELLFEDGDVDTYVGNQLGEYKQIKHYIDRGGWVQVSLSVTDTKTDRTYHADPLVFYVHEAPVVVLLPEYLGSNNLPAYGSEIYPISVKANKVNTSYDFQGLIFNKTLVRLTADVADRDSIDDLQWNICFDKGYPGNVWIDDARNDWSIIIEVGAKDVVDVEIYYVDSQGASDWTRITVNSQD